MAAQYLHGIPSGSGNLTLIGTGLLAGATLGTLCGLATRVFRGKDGAVWAKDRVGAAVLWVLGVGARLAFSLYTSHGGLPAIALRYRRLVVSEPATPAAEAAAHAIMESSANWS